MLCGSVPELIEPRARADDIERRAPGARERARRRLEDALADAGNRVGERPFESICVGRGEGRRHDRVGILDRGALLSLDTAAGLKRRYGAATLEDAFLAATGRALEDGEDDDDEEAA